MSASGVQTSDAQEFVPFGLSHGVVIVVLTAVAAALVVLGRRQRGTAAQQRTSRAFAVIFVLFLIPLYLYSMLPGQWGIEHSLPLQLCDLAALAAIWALWSHSAAASALTYFWGLTLTAQGFVSPALEGPDFPALEFIMFFGMHCLVVWAAIYLTWGVGLRPDWRGYRIAALATITWGGVMFVFNRAAGTNYGFLNAKPPTGSLLDVLGPWPWYLLSELILGAAVWALITLPWVRKALTRPARPPSAEPVGGLDR
ncbi:MAG: TIGR02206 family membrane protein [Pseudonocardiaceae bacterium]